MSKRANNETKGTTMTRKQALWSMWYDRVEMMGYRLGDNNELRVSDLRVIWTLAFTSDKQRKFYRDKMEQVAQIVRDFREAVAGLYEYEVDAKLETLMVEIEAFAKRNEITTK